MFMILRHLLRFSTDEKQMFKCLLLNRLKGKPPLFSRGQNVTCFCYFQFSTCVRVWSFRCMFFLFSIIFDQHYWPGLVLFSHSVWFLAQHCRGKLEPTLMDVLAVMDTNGRQLQAKNRNKVKGSENLGVVPAA